LPGQLPPDFFDAVEKFELAPHLESYVLNDQRPERAATSAQRNQHPGGKAGFGARRQRRACGAHHQRDVAALVGRKRRPSYEFGHVRRSHELDDVRTAVVEPHRNFVRGEEPRRAFAKNFEARSKMERRRHRAREIGYERADIVLQGRFVLEPRSLERERNELAHKRRFVLRRARFLDIRDAEEEETQAPVARTDRHDHDRQRPQPLDHVGSVGHDDRRIAGPRAFGCRPVAIARHPRLLIEVVEPARRRGDQFAAARIQT
jgi:hypothetical protein